MPLHSFQFLTQYNWMGSKKETRDTHIMNDSFEDFQFSECLNLIYFRNKTLS